MGWVVNATPRPLYARERPGTHCIEGCVGPKGGLDGCGKSHPPPGFDPRTVQPVANRLNYSGPPVVEVSKVFCFVSLEAYFETGCLEVQTQDKVANSQAFVQPNKLPRL